MTTIKECNLKIESLKNTKKITNAMKMVSVSKLRRAQQAQTNAKIYAKNITTLISRLSASVDPQQHPLLMPRKNVRSILILVITSDKGLCGAFNNNINKQVLSWIQAHQGQYVRVDISCCGKKANMFFRRRITVKKYYSNMTVSPNFANAETIGNDLINDFLNRTYDEVYVTYNEFFSPLSQKITFDKILPVDPKALLKEEGVKKSRSIPYLFEPPIFELLNFLIPHFVFFKIYFALLENSAGEHGARMIAMDSATKNAAELTNKYVLYRNRARQAAITTELLEIIAGAEALK